MLDRLWLGWTLVLATAAIALFSLTHRVRVESRNKAVTLCMEAASLQDAALGGDIPLADMLVRAKAGGLGAVAMNEQPLLEVLDRGDLKVQVTTGGEPGWKLSGREEAIERAFWALNARYPNTAILVSRKEMLVRSLSLSDLEDASLGLDPQVAKDVVGAGLTIVARLQNQPATGSGYVSTVLSRAKALGAKVYLPTGDQVLGQRDTVKRTAESIRDLGLVYASPEFAKIGGDAKLAGMLTDRLVRLHSMQAQEVDRATPGEYVDRYTKAARERNIRILLVRPLTWSSESPAGAVTDALAKLRRAIQREHGPLGAAKPFEDPQVPAWVLLALGIAVGATALWTALQILPGRWAWVLGGLGAVAAVAGGASEGLRTFAALVAALSFPVLAYVLIERAERMQPIAAFAAVSLVSLVGGLSVSGLLIDLPFLVRVDQFMAVKAAHFLPILVIAVWLFSRRFDLRAAMRSPVVWGAAVASMVLVGAMGMMLMRTGNDNPAAVGGLELKVRGILDALLYTRPRTKEFILGHPALLLGLLANAAALRSPDATEKQFAWATGLMALGAIGQTSIVNTLCHLHTPLHIGVARILIGWVLGGLVGLALWPLVRRVLGTGT